MTDRELLEQALKLVSKYHARETILVEWEKSVIEAINARLNERESSDKPVAWMDTSGRIKGIPANIGSNECAPLYRRPQPARKLTDEEIVEVLLSLNLYHTYKGPLITAFARAIERRINGEEE